MRLALLAGACGALYLFRAPLLVWVDHLRLPEVEVAVAALRSPGAGGAVSGAAANGYIVARTRAALSADTPGRIVEINVREGEAVKKGFVVARLYADEYAASLRRAEADILAGRAALRRAQAERAAAEADAARLGAARNAAASAEAEAEAEKRLADLNHERVRELVAGGSESKQREDETRMELETAEARVASSRSQLTAAEAALAEGRSRVDLAAAAVEEAAAEIEVLKAARDLAQATLEKTEVKAPFDGVIVLKDAEVGEVVSPNSQAGSNARGSVVTMVDFKTLEAQAEVPETSLAAVRLDAPVRVFLDAYPDQAYKGRVDRIWPTANRQKATIEVRAVFDEPDERLRPEMGVRVVFLDASADGVNASTDGLDASADGAAECDAPEDGSAAVPLVPEDALVRVDGQDALFVLERDIARLRPVTVGERRSGRAAVLEGLGGGERVIRQPPPRLADGDRVREKK
jgi:multidrug efflux pump subunit AcrA (membrane-fusion protein)